MHSNPNTLQVKVIKSLHGQDAGFGNQGCISNGIWAKIVGSSNYLHSSGIFPDDFIRFRVGCGTLTRFLKDTWISNSPLYLRFNRLFWLQLNKDCYIIDRIYSGQQKWNWSTNVLGVRNSAYLRDLLNEISQADISSNSYACIWSLSNDGHW